MKGLCSGLGRLKWLVDGGGVFWRNGRLSGRHGLTEVGDGVDGCIRAAEEGGGQKAGCDGAEGGHCEGDYRQKGLICSVV